MKRNGLIAINVNLNNPIDFLKFYKATQEAPFNLTIINGNNDFKVTNIDDLASLDLKKNVTVVVEEDIDITEYDVREYFGQFETCLTHKEFKLNTKEDANRFYELFAKNISTEDSNLVMIEQDWSNIDMATPREKMHTSLFPTSAEDMNKFVLGEPIYITYPDYTFEGIDNSILKGVEAITKAW